MATLFVAEEMLPIVAPIVVYWVGSGIYATLMRSMKNRLFSQEEEDAQNIATRRQVVVGVLVNQALQVALATLAFLGKGREGATDDGASRTASPALLSLLRASWQLAVSVMIMDAWEYFWHRWTHENKFLYKHVHSMHHRLVVPYAFGAQYMHPIDSLAADGIGSIVAALVTGMSPRTSAFFFILLTVKGLDDHCGMWFPGSPSCRFLSNNSAMHALHHQHQGIKHNYSIYFLSTWDKLLGTYMPYVVEERKSGGYQLRPVAAKDSVGGHHD